MPLQVEPVIGGEELRRAFVRAGASFNHEMKDRLVYFAAPVEHDAENLALGADVGVSWSDMRRGSAPAMVYIAPVHRGTRVRYRKRRNFAEFLIGRAMGPALDRNREGIIKDIDKLLARLERNYERG